MNRYVKTALLAGAAWSALSTFAVAQDSAPQDGVSSLDDVVVSARRRDELLKDVPISVSAIGAERLEQTGAADITALQQQTPNATVQVARGSNSTLISFIRGVGQQDPLWGFEPGVGLYVDDVYVARRVPFSTSTTSSASKCCAARKARCTAATRSAVPSNM